MLANLLPGLRELRAPLAAGYLWLMFLWLLTAPSLPSEKEAGRFLSSLYELFDNVGALGGGVAITFVAYLIGTVSAALSEPFIQWSFSLGSRPRTMAVSRRGVRSIRLLVDEEVRKLEERLNSLGLTIAQAERRETQSEIAAQMGISEDAVEAAMETLSNFQSVGVTIDDLRHLDDLAKRLRATGISLSDFAKSLEVKRRMAGIGLEAARLDQADEIQRVMQRHGLSESDTRQLQDLTTRLEGLGLSLEEVHEADDMERQLELRGIDLGAPTELETLQRRAEAGVTSTADDHRLAELRQQLGALDVPLKEIIRAQEVKSRLNRAGFTFDVGRVLQQTKTRLRNANLSPEKVDGSVDVVRDLNAIGVSLDEARKCQAHLRAAGFADVANERLVHMKQLIEAVGDLDLSADDVERSQSLLMEVELGAPAESHDIVKTQWDVGELPARVIDELDLITTRLIGKEPELHSTADRLRAEAEFRFAILPPLVALMVLMVVQWHSAWAFLLFPVWVLYRDGIQRRRAAGDRVADALYLRRIHAPALEKFTGSVQGVIRDRDDS